MFHYRTKISAKFGSIDVSNKRVRFGFGGSPGISRNIESWLIIRKGHLSFKGEASFAAGTTIRLDTGDVVIGDNFTANKNFWLAINTNLTVGNDCLVGANVKIRDNDGHAINGVNKQLPLTIGQHCWLGDDVLLLKGVHLGNNCVVAARSVLTSSSTRGQIPENAILGGQPGKIIKEKISWQH